MPTVFTPSAAAPPTSYTHPSDGDSPIKAADVTVPLEAIERAVLFLANGSHSSVSPSYWHRNDWVPVGQTIWDFGDDAAHWGPSQISVSAAGKIFLPLDVPHGCTLVGVAVYIKGGAGHGGTPGTMPTFKVYKFDPSSGTQTQIGSTVTATYGSAGAYEAIHSMGTSSPAEVIDRTTKRYYVMMSGEAGANAQTGLRITGALVQITATTVDWSAS